MSEDRPSPSTTAQRSWLGRLSQAFSSTPTDREELTDLIRESQQKGLVDADALAMIEGVLHVSELQARDIMVPRSQVAALSRDASPQELLPIIVETGHSRFPVTGDNRDDVVGILIAKDLLAMFANQGNGQELRIREILRPALFIPEAKRLDALLKQFRESRNHLAVVVDEYGGMAGIVTIEDVLEQIVGDIGDEHDFEEDTQILTHENGHTIVKALTPIEDFNEHFGTAFSDEEFDTIGGLVAHSFGRLPRRGESVELGAFRFQVIRADNRRIHLLMVTRAETGTTQ
ncbi:HlyC/CorC family transporter [Alkalilimnicola sp. S0819]|uniref:HlyC/CorC family transporter n=1 Tax=Alkalilimnicola sp. S0819 TaxID=2613922 RepID=UPI001261DF8F|nr:transporter associated domain-containing protein [Alkalilimnicola sp. S0819]KAB7628259.1 CBS domain-containing protein [Alkalilimnicola sp. S0819]MPQ15153.1 CBS domain-containing protein [Alkalilimnicola sp. S0819]